MSFHGIQRGETYQYRFAVRQAGTYWYHSHSAFQEQVGLYGALVIDPAEPEPFAYDREYVVLLSDWTDLNPTALFARLKEMPDHDNYHKRTLADFARDAQRNGLTATLADRKMWGEMRMTPTDLSDVNANTYTYLMNGATSLANWTGLFRSGEKVRLRFINGSAMTYFDVRIPGLKMTVVAADGQYVHPVSVDEFRIAVAEVYDVIVEPSGQDAFTIFAQDMGRTGYVSGTLAVREGVRAPVPAIDPRAILTMDDTGHGGMEGGHDMSSMSNGATDNTRARCKAWTRVKCPAWVEWPAWKTAPAQCSSIQPARSATHWSTCRPWHQCQSSTIRASDLRDNGRTVLTYAALKSVFADPDGREPARTVELHLTGHMEKFAWSFDGIKFSGAEPLRLNYGERLRIVLVNDTMMTHPIHLHGMWSDVEDEHGNFHLRKHTVDMPPGSKRSYRVRADALGRWAYHCHLLYHMEAGMMREVRVEE
jgi:CopA family copper-resistance protein